MSTQRAAAASKKARRAARGHRYYSGTVTEVVDTRHAVVAYLGQTATCVSTGFTVVAGDLVRIRVKGNDRVIESMLNVDEVAGIDVGSFSGGSAANMVGGWEMRPNGALEQWCSVDITPVASTWTYTTWTFHIPFVRPPRVIVGNGSSQNGSLTLWGSRNKTATQAEIGLIRSSITPTTLDVLARGWWRLPA